MKIHATLRHRFVHQLKTLVRTRGFEFTRWRRRLQRQLLKPRAPRSAFKRDPEGAWLGCFGLGVCRPTSNHNGTGTSPLHLTHLYRGLPHAQKTTGLHIGHPRFRRPCSHLYAELQILQSYFLLPCSLPSFIVTHLSPSPGVRKCIAPPSISPMVRTASTANVPGVFWSSLCTATPPPSFAMITLAFVKTPPLVSGYV